MEQIIRKGVRVFMLCSVLFTSTLAAAETPDSLPRKGFRHSISAEFRPEYILPTNSFVRGDNMRGKKIQGAMSGHLRYSFRFRPGSYRDRVYSGVYQGIGVAYYSLENKREVGSPGALYFFQGARIAQMTPRMSLNYEWNLGLSYGLEPHDDITNPDNDMLGSKLNLYLSAGLHFNWMLTPHLDLRAGLAFSHFSNGNTKLPNKGMNILGLKLGLMYNFGSAENPLNRPQKLIRPPEFYRHMSYDLVLFGGLRGKEVDIYGDHIRSPHNYGLAGLNFAAMYNFNHLFKGGFALDGVYDGSANVYVDPDESNGTDYIFRTPALIEQISLGISARGELVMPYFTLGVGMGLNFLCKGDDQKVFYTLLTLKIAMTRNTFLNLNYCLKNFKTPNPNFLMMGVGFRFNNKYPVVR